MRDIHPIPTRLNLLLAAVFALLQLGLLYSGQIWLALVAALSTTAYWALAHEAVHGVFHPDHLLNHRLGRILAILHGAPFVVLRAGHLLHHKYSRTADASEVFDPALEGPWRARLRHYWGITLGLYVSEVAAGLMLWLPTRPRTALARRIAGNNPMLQRLTDYVTRPKALAEGRVDALAVIAVYGLAFYAWGGDWPWLVAMIALRGFMISFFDNAYHYGTPLGGDPRSARNHRLPTWAAPLILNFNWHGVHHRYPTVPWIALPKRAGETETYPDGGYFSQVMRQWLGPIPVARLQKLPGAAR